jgi:hypothetical protein
LETTDFPAQGIQWFKEHIAPRLAERYQTKYTFTSEGDLGSLEAVEFNSAERGGYVHFWSGGYVGFELVDYQTGDEIVQDVLIEWAQTSQDFGEVLAPLIVALTE